jgi:hypothetical protein
MRVKQGLQRDLSKIYLRLFKITFTNRGRLMILTLKYLLKKQRILKIYTCSLYPQLSVKERVLSMERNSKISYQVLVHKKLILT